MTGRLKILFLVLLISSAIYGQTPPVEKSTPRSIRITIFGEVNSPKVIVKEKAIDILEALTIADGPTASVGGEIYIYRKEPGSNSLMTFRFNLIEVLSGKAAIYLWDEDIILLPEYKEPKKEIIKAPAKPPFPRTPDFPLPARISPSDV